MTTLSSRATFRALAPMTLLLAACSGQGGDGDATSLATEEHMARTVATMMAMILKCSFGLFMAAYIRDPLR